MKLQYFDVSSEEFKINGVSINELAIRAGGTPFFIYDKRIVKKKIDELRSHLPRELNIHYAIKANPMCALVGYIANHVDGFDVSSANELTLALNSGMDAQNISFAGPGNQSLS